MALAPTTCTWCWNAWIVTCGICWMQRGCWRCGKSRSAQCMRKMVITRWSETLYGLLQQQVVDVLM